PEDYTLIKDGILADYHTTRETAQALAPWYAKQHRPVRSHGCASAETALGVTLVQPPNIDMHSGSTATTFDDLVAGLDKGLVIKGARVSMDRQQLNGEINGKSVYEVRKGKFVRFIRQAECLFRAPEFWKNLQAI